MLDYSLPEFSFTIGSFDVSDYVDSITLTQPLAEINRTLSTTAEFSISYNLQAIQTGLTEADFSPLETPSRWRPAQQLVTLSLNGYTAFVGYIESYVYDAQSRTGEGTLHQVLDLAQQGNRSNEELEIELGEFGAPIQSVVQGLLTKAYEGAAFTPVIQLSALTGDIDGRITTKDPIEDAQRLASTNWQWLYVDVQNRIRTVSGDPRTQSIVFVRGPSQVELVPDTDAINFAADKVIVTGSRQALPDRSKLPTYISISVKDLKPDPEAFDDQGRPRKKVTSETKRKAEVFPDLYTETIDGKVVLTDTSNMLFEEKTIEYLYFDNGTVFENIPRGVDKFGEPLVIPQVKDLPYQQGALAQTITTWLRPRGFVFAGEEEFKGDTSLIIAEKLIECDHVKVYYRPKHTTQYAALGVDSAKFDTSLDLYRVEPIETGRVNPDGTLGSGVNRDGKEKQLESKYKVESTYTVADRPLVTENLVGNCDLQPVGWTPFRKTQYREDVGFCPSQAHIDLIAQQIGLREIRRRDGVLVTMPLPIEWLAAGCPPLQRCQIAGGEYQIDNAILAIDGAAKTCTFAFAGGRVGTITPPIPDPFPPSPWLPQFGVSIVPIAGVVTAVGVPIAPTQLYAVGGTGPYTWSAPSLPAGLTLSTDGILSGTPQSPITTAVEVTATDSLGADGYLNVSIVVSPVTPPVQAVLVAGEQTLSATAVFDYLLSNFVNADASLEMFTELVNVISAPVRLALVLAQVNTIDTQARARLDADLANTLPLTVRAATSIAVANVTIAQARTAMVPSSLDPKTTALLAAFTGSYNDAERDAINTFYTGLDGNNLLNSIDRLFILAGKTQSDGLIDWRNPSRSATVTNNPTFAPSQGFSPVSGSFIDTQFNPSTGLLRMNATSGSNTFPTTTAHGLNVGDSRRLSNFTNTAIAPFTLEQTYFVVGVPSTTSVQWATTAGGTPITATTTWSDGRAVILPAGQAYSNNMASLGVWIRTSNGTGTIVDLVAGGNAEINQSRVYGAASSAVPQARVHTSTGGPAGVATSPLGFSSVTRSFTAPTTYSVQARKNGTNSGTAATNAPGGMPTISFSSGIIRTNAGATEATQATAQQYCLFVIGNFTPAQDTQFYNLALPLLQSLGVV